MLSTHTYYGKTLEELALLSRQERKTFIFSHGRKTSDQPTVIKKNKKKKPQRIPDPIHKQVAGFFRNLDRPNRVQVAIHWY